MTATELKDKYYDLYWYMSNSGKSENMKAFGKVMNEMMEWMIANKPDAAQDWIDRLESIEWDNYLTTKEAEKIVSSMIPKAPWSREQWKSAMTQKGYPIEKDLCYNSCALWVTMNMIMSDSSDTIKKYVKEDNVFDFVYEEALNKLQDEDGNFDIRTYFKV